MTKVSLKAAAQAAKRIESKLPQQLPDGSGLHVTSATIDSFQNFQHKLGIGTDNALSGATYGFNPISRNRTLLEWMHRGSWLAGRVVDTVADDMTREGVEIKSQMEPDEQESLQTAVTSMALWPKLNETIRWGRLYGGCLAIALIDGQDMRSPLRIESVGKGQFKGLLVLDRWMVNPALEDLVTDFGPHLGMPKYYRVESNAPALRGQVVHYSRVMVRHDGVILPYQQRLTENLWGLSVLERLYDRMIAFDSASTGAAQLVYKSYLRTLSIEGLRDVIGAGGPALDGVVRYVQMMTRFQGIEGMSLIDVKDKFEGHTHTAFSGMADIMDKLGEQVSGAAEIPLTRLFGQAPSGLNATDESGTRNYYDSIGQRQQTDMHDGVTKCYRLTAQSEGLKLDDQFAVAFKPLWKMTPKEKSEVAKSTQETITSYYDSGIIGRQTALKEIRQSSRETGVGTNITDEMIEAADDEVAPPMGELDAQGLPPQGQEGSEGLAANAGGGSPVRNPAAVGGEAGRVDPSRAGS